MNEFYAMLGKYVIIWIMESHIAIVGELSPSSTPDHYLLLNAVVAPHVAEGHQTIDVWAEAGPDVGEVFTCVGKHTVDKYAIREIRPVDPANVELYQNFCK